MEKSKVLDKLATNLGKSGDDANIALALDLCAHGTKEDMDALIEGLQGKNKAIASDCIKVLYEIGYRDPERIAGYAETFITLLSSRNNRLVWGSMIALGTVAALNPDTVYAHIDTVVQAYRNGSVITRDNSIRVFAALCKAKPAYHENIFPLIIEHLRTCRAKEVPQHAERAFVCIDASSAQVFIQILENRSPQLTQSQQKRVDTLIKNAKKLSVLT